MSPGGHFGAVLLTKQPSVEFVNATGIGFEVGTILNLQVGGDVIIDSSIRSFAPSSLIYDKAQVHFVTVVENRGNILTRPRGIVEVRNMFGTKVAVLPVNEQGAGVFPKDSRQFDTDWLPEDIQFGRFEAVVALNFGDEQSIQTISATASFWVLPRNIVLPVLGGILVFALIVYGLLRLYINRQLASVRNTRSMSREHVVGLSRLAAVIIAILIAVIIGLLVLFFYFG